MDGKDGLQLLPGTKKRLGIKVPGENRFLYIGSALLGAVIVTSLWLNFGTQSLNSQIKSLDEQIAALDQKRNKSAEVNIKLIQRQLALTTELINGHYYTSQALLKLSSLIQEKIQIEDVSIAPDGKVVLGGFAAGYSTIAKQMAAFFADDSVKDMSLGTMESQTDGTIKFNMQIEFDQAKLLQKVK